MTRPDPRAHCGWCGTAFPAGAPWPRLCRGCGRESFRNPVPVAVAVLPVDGGLLVIRRGIPPGLGELALPGGFMEPEEDWREAVARELREETGIEVPGDEARVHAVLSAPVGHLLVFGLLAPRRAADLPPFVANPEVRERLVIGAPCPLAFPLHERVARDWFAARSGGWVAG